MPLTLAGTLASGLPAESRCVRRLSGQTLSTEVQLLAILADRLGLLLWRYCKEGTVQPVSILDQLAGKAEKKPKAVIYRSGADFEAALSWFVR